MSLQSEDKLEFLLTGLLKKPHPLLVILGPTASGKTALSIKIAKKYNGEIVSADSRQIYKHLNISTDKISLHERKGIPHHMIDIVDPDQMYTTGEYKRDATRIIDEIHGRGKLPILVGGTGLYISAIVHNYDIPKVPPQKDFRLHLQNEAEKHGIKYLYNKLQEVDRAAAKKIHPNNLRYIIRALEINEVTKRNKNDQKFPPKYDALMIGIDWPREVLYDRINQRVELQIERGLLEEIKSVLDQNLEKGLKPDLSGDLPSMTAIGCKELMAYFQEKMTPEQAKQAKDLIRRNTRTYARRQLSWFRREKEIIWLSPDGVATARRK